MVSKRVIAAIVLSTIMLISAGCAGWGDDGPADPEAESDGNGEAQEDAESPQEDAEGTDNDEDTDPVDEEDDSQNASPEPDDDESDDTDENDSMDSEETDNSEDTEEQDTEETEETDETDNSDGDGEEQESDETDEDEYETETLTITAYDVNGYPVEDVHVVAMDADGERQYVYEEWTDEDGTAEMEVRDDIDYAISAEADGYQDTTLDSFAGWDMSIEMEHEFVEHTTVVEDTDGEPIEGAEVIYSEGGVHLETDENGEASMTVDPGYESYNYEVHATHPEYEDPEAVAFDPAEEQETVFVLEEQESGEDEYETNTLTVTVTGTPTHDPIEGATVTAAGADGNPEDAEQYIYEAETDEDGVAEMEVRQDMNYVITADAPAYETGHTEVSLDREASVVLQHDLGE